MGRGVNEVVAEVGNRGSVGRKKGPGMTTALALQDDVEVDEGRGLVAVPSRRKRATRFGEIVVQLVGMSEVPVDPAWISPVALVLREEGLIQLPEVTFGSNYDLDVRSLEIE